MLKQINPKGTDCSRFFSLEGRVKNIITAWRLKLYSCQ